MKVNLTKEERALLQKVAKECITSKYQASLSSDECILLGNLLYKLGLHVS